MLFYGINDLSPVKYIDFDFISDKGLRKSTLGYVLCWAEEPLTRGVSNRTILLVSPRKLSI